MLVSPQAKVSSVCTPSCYALCAACDMLPTCERSPLGPWQEDRRRSLVTQVQVKWRVCCQFGVRSKHSKRDCEHERDLDPSCLFQSCEFCRFWSDAEFIQVSGGIWYEGSRIRFLNENACIRESIDGAQPPPFVSNASFFPLCQCYVVSGLRSRGGARWHADSSGRHRVRRLPGHGDSWIGTWKHQSIADRRLPRRWCAVTSRFKLELVSFNFREG